MRLVLEDCRTISPETGFYDGWSTICRRRDGSLWLAYSGGRDRHVCPFGRVEVMMSPDEGATWTWPRTILDSPFDDRDGGVVETASGALLVSSFSSQAYRRLLDKAQAAQAEGAPLLPEADLRRWQQADLRGRLAGDEALGQWVLRSSDGGISWSEPVASLVNAPHGPVVLSDGSLVYAGKEIYPAEAGQEGRIGLCRSFDDGLSWQWVSAIPVREGDTVRHYHELHVVEALNGHLIVQIRNENPNNEDETLQTESRDGGVSWTEPHPIGVWGTPSHLLRLDDGRLLMTYGYRRRPFGNQARISSDCGQSWSEPLTISDDGTCTDLGYPSTVQLSDNRFLTIWYERKDSARRAVLRQARWQLA